MSSHMYHEKKIYDIYIDGSDKGNRVGWSVFWSYNDQKNLNDIMKGNDATCARAEVMALYRVLCQLDFFIKVDTTVQFNNIFNIKSDNMYVVNAFNKWVNNWIKNGWKTTKGDVAHIDLWSEIYQFKLKYNNIVNISHVPAHSGIYGNEMADLLAKGELDKVLSEEDFNKEVVRE